MPNQVYDNFYLAHEVEDQYVSHLDLMRFVTIDNTLEGHEGMTKKVHVYKATDGTEKVTKGRGNTKAIEVSYTEKEYKIILAQNDFKWNDEDAMTDPMLVPVGMRHAGTDLFNTVQKDIYGEFNKASLTVTATAPNFDAFVDAQAKLNLENLEDVYQFAFVNPADVAKVRKALKDSLQYVEAFATNGYIGTVAGVNVFTTKITPENTIIVATNGAVTLFNKTGIEVEQDRDKNLRINDIYTRKYYVAALTDETKAVKITINGGMA